jgi:hypothetical protein
MVPFYTPHVKIVEFWLNSLINLVLIQLLQHQIQLQVMNDLHPVNLIAPHIFHTCILFYFDEFHLMV